MDAHRLHADVEPAGDLPVAAARADQREDLLLPRGQLLRGAAGREPRRRPAASGAHARRASGTAPSRAATTRAASASLPGRLRVAGREQPRRPGAPGCALPRARGRTPRTRQPPSARRRRARRDRAARRPASATAGARRPAGRSRPRPSGPIGAEPRRPRLGTAVDELLPLRAGGPADRWRTRGRPRRRAARAAALRAGSAPGRPPPQRRDGGDHVVVQPPSAPPSRRRARAGRCRRPGGRPRSARRSARTAAGRPAVRPRRARHARRRAAARSRRGTRGPPAATAVSARSSAASASVPVAGDVGDDRDLPARGQRVRRPGLAGLGAAPHRPLVQRERDRQVSAARSGAGPACRGRAAHRPRRRSARARSATRSTAAISLSGVARPLLDPGQHELGLGDDAGRSEPAPPGRAPPSARSSGLVVPVPVGQRPGQHGEHVGPELVGFRGELLGLGGEGQQVPVGLAEQVEAAPAPTAAGPVRWPAASGGQRRELRLGQRDRPGHPARRRRRESRADTSRLIEVGSASHDVRARRRAPARSRSAASPRRGRRGPSPPRRPGGWRRPPSVASCEAAACRASSAARPGRCLARRPARRRSPRAGGPARRAADPRRPPRRAASAGSRSARRPRRRAGSPRARCGSPAPTPVGGRPLTAGEHVVRHVVPGDRRGAQHGAGVRIQPVEPDEQHVGEVGRQIRRARGAGGDQLLDVERVALGPVDDALRLLGRQAAGVQLGDEAAGVGRRRAGPGSAGTARAAEPIPRAPVAADADGGRPRCGRTRRPRSGPRPVGRTTSRAGRGWTGRPSARPRRPAAAGPASATRRRVPCTASISSARSSAASARRPVRPGGGPGAAGARRAEPPHRRARRRTAAQRLDERQVGQPAVAEVQAVADEDPPPGRLGPRPPPRPAAGSCRHRRRRPRARARPRRAAVRRAPRGGRARRPGRSAGRGSARWIVAQTARTVGAAAHASEPAGHAARPSGPLRPDRPAPARRRGGEAGDALLDPRQLDLGERCGLHPDHDEPPGAVLRTTRSLRV